MARPHAFRLWLLLWQVRLGGYRQPGGRRGANERRRAVRALIHPRFKTGVTDPLTDDLLNNDVALLLLDRPSTMPPVRLARHRAKVNWTNPAPDYTTVTMLGWGLIYPDPADQSAARLPDRLQLLTTTLLPLATCQKERRLSLFTDDQGRGHHVVYNWDTNTMICTKRKAGQTAESRGVPW
ncbi:expressed protein [Chlorella variabilis]|uniref:Expressed protein n=1 Tax=Chlorella variabilis TaxID=554065 RepID=E1ZM65_CHLVA|nr:expressed protein [Chlorella variabilis]EFN52951.1 expressed protein [Chlorella variabilis]|eukprot:XP_005845053.1 expressed protein [Chlorella variabilis]